MTAERTAGTEPDALPFFKVAESDNSAAEPGWLQAGAGKGVLLAATPLDHNARWPALYDMVVKLTHSLYGGDVVRDILGSSVDLLQARGARLFMYDAARGDLTLVLSYAKSGQALGEPGLRAGRGEGLAGQVYEQRRPVVVQDYSAWPGRLLDSSPHCALGVPLFGDAGVLGVLIVTDGVDRIFSEEDTQLLTVFASHISAVLIGARDRGRQEAAALREERARMARDLHDGLAQELAAILIRVELCCRLAAEDGELAAQLAAVLKMVRRSIRETRSSVLALHTPDLLERSVEHSLRSLAERFITQTGVPVGVTVSGRAPACVPVAHELTLVRVAQEALNNVRAHADARHVELRLTWAGPGRPALAGRPHAGEAPLQGAAQAPGACGVQLTVADDGCGFDPNGLADGAAHWGLLFMQERVEALGGELLIASAPGCGTQISISLPLR